MKSPKPAAGITLKNKVAFEGLKSLPVSVAVLDSSGTIVAVNKTWEQFGRRNGLRVPRYAVGLSYLHYCLTDEPNSRRFVTQLKALLAGRRDLLTFIYPCHSRMQARWFCLIGLPLSLSKSGGVALMHVNLTTMLPLHIGARRFASKREESSSSPAGRPIRLWRNLGAFCSGAPFIPTEWDVHRTYNARKQWMRPDERGTHSAEQAADGSPEAAGPRQDQQGNRDGAFPFSQHHQAARFRNSGAPETQEPRSSSPSVIKATAE